MAISGMLFASVIGVMFLSVKLVRTAPPDTNPHTFGALATSLARLEGSLVAPLGRNRLRHSTRRPHRGNIEVGFAVRVAPVRNQLRRRR